MDGTNKALGYFLLGLGILIIGFSTFSVYQVYNGKMKAYDLFAFKAISMDLSSMVPGAPKNSLTQELISSELLNKPMNMVFHLVLMGFIAGAGFKVANLGVLLARTIKVNVKEEKSVLFPPKS